MAVAVTDLCAIAPDCHAVVLALAPGCLHVVCTQSNQLLALHKLVPGVQGMQVRGPGAWPWLAGAGSASPQLRVLRLQLQLLANQLQELPVGEASIDSQGNCEFVMHLEDVGAGDSWFSLLQAGNGMSPCVVWQAQGCGNCGCLSCAWTLAGRQPQACPRREPSNRLGTWHQIVALG